MTCPVTSRTVTAWGLAFSLFLITGRSGADRALAEGPSGPTPAERLIEAEGLIAARAEGEALRILRQIADLRYEDPAVAAQAQYRIGECLFANYQRPKEAEPELIKVISDFPEQYEPVNAARVKLLNLYVFDKNWTNVPALTESVRADYRAGRAKDEFAAWALIYNSIMHEEFARNAAAIKNGLAVLDERQAAAGGYLEAADMGRGLAVGAEAIRRLVDLLCQEHLSSEIERNAGRGWLAESRAVLAASLVGRPETAEGNNLNGHQALLRLGERAERAREWDEAIAWYRLAAVSPHRDSSQEREAALNVGRLLNLHHAGSVEAWWTAMANADPMFDPTESIVVREIGFSPRMAGNGASLNPAHYEEALGHIYTDQGRFIEAEQRYRKALTLSTSSRDRAEVLTGLSKALCGQLDSRRLDLEVVLPAPRSQEEQAAQMARASETRAAYALAHSHMTEASAFWLDHAIKGTSGDSHYANEKAVEGWKAISRPREALATADRFVGELIQAQVPLSKIAFARLMRARALGLWNHRPAEAMRAVLQLADELRSVQGADIRVICVLSLLDAVVYEAAADEPFLALKRLKEIDSEYRDDFGHWIEKVRSLVQVYYLSTDGPPSR